MKIGLTLWNKSTKEGFPIKIRITDKGKYTYFSTGISIERRFWNRNSKEVRQSHPDCKNLNETIHKKLDEVKSQKGVFSKDNVLKFTDDYIKHLLLIGQFGTYKRVKVIYYNLENFIKNELKRDDIKWTELDTDFLKKWKEHLMTRKIKNTTLKNYFKKLKQVWNKGKMEKIHNVPDPFTSIKIKEDEVLHRGLTKEQFLELLRYRLSNKESFDHTFVVLDVFIFQVFGGGMRIGDVLSLKWKNIDGNFIRYRMTKTKKDVVVPISKDLFEIIGKYYPVHEDRLIPFSSSLFNHMEEIKERFIFPFMTNDIPENTIQYYNKISSKTTIINKELKIIGTGLNIPKLTSHVSRHTISSIMNNDNVNMSFIQKMLGHSSLKITERYLNTLTDKEFETGMNEYMDNINPFNKTKKKIVRRDLI